MPDKWEQLPQRLRDSPYTVAVSSPMAEMAGAYKQATYDLAEQFCVNTATWALVEWERLVGITPAAGQTLEARRSAVIAKLCSSGTTNAEMIRALAEALTGYSARVTENFGDYSFSLRFIIEIIRWGDIEAAGMTWADMEERFPTWADVENAFFCHKEE